MKELFYITGQQNYWTCKGIYQIAKLSYSKELI